jgi:hypothetical protein
MNAITTKPQAKTIVCALRRELKALDKGTAALSHNDCLALMAKALGYPNWNAWEASLAEGTDSAPAAVQGTDRPKYPLVNTGDFDFVKPGEEGVPYTGHFALLEGTLDSLTAKGYVNFATRPTPDNPVTDDSGIHTEGAGESKMFWDEQSPVVRDGFQVWLCEGGDEHSQAQMVLVPEGADPQDDEDGDLPVREKLIDAFLEFFAGNEVDSEAKQGDFSNVEGTIGFSLTEKETEVLRERLFNTKPLF